MSKIMDKRNSLLIRGLLFIGVSMMMCVALSPHASALSLGDPAPSLRIAHWIKGGPVNLKAGKAQNIFVIEFWKTTCPHCKKSIPHLTNLQKRFRENGVVVVGITEETPEVVQSFLAEAENKDIDYILATDDDEKTKSGYMEAFGIEGVPHAFIVNKQAAIVWEGHPLDGLEKALEEIVQGKYDLEHAKRESSAKKMMLPYLFFAIETRENDITRMIGERIFEYGKDNPKLLDKLAWRIVSDARIQQPDLEMALKAINRAYTTTGETNSSVLDTYAHVLNKLGKNEDAEFFFEKAKLVKQKEESPESCENE